MEKIKRTKGERILYIFIFAVLLIYALFILYHFYFLLQLSTKDFDSYKEGIQFKKLAVWGPGFDFGNFLKAFTELEISTFNGDVDFLAMTWNSIWFSVGSMVISLFFESAVTYIICKYKFPGRSLLYNLVIFRLMLPIVGSLPSAYRVYNAIGLINSPLILITAVDALTGANFLIMYSFYKGISWEYAEAAFIDGANHFDVFFRIMFPMVMPAVSVLFITGFIGRWNEYMTVSVFMDELPTLAYGLYALQEESKSGDMGRIYYAGVAIASVPCITLFILFQNTIMQTVHMGGIKG